MPLRDDFLPMRTMITELGAYPGAAHAIALFWYVQLVVAVTARESAKFAWLWLEPLPMNDGRSVVVAAVRRTNGSPPTTSARSPSANTVTGLSFAGFLVFIMHKG